MCSCNWYKYLLLILLFCFADQVNAQTYTGVWTGYLTASDSSVQGITINIKVQNNNIITGRSYLYHANQSELSKNFSFKGTMDFIGTVSAEGCRITELAIPDSVSSTDSLLVCRKIFGLKIKKEKELYFLSGECSAASASACPAGFVTLKRYVGNQPGKFYLPPQIEQKIRYDDIAGIKFYNTRLTKPVVLKVTSPNIKLEIFDYLEKDNDSVSVYYNRNKIISNYRITNKVLTQNIKLDKSSGLNELVFFAENLGWLPPNTCTVFVNDGKSRQQVNVISNKRYSAAIYLQYEL